ncbi:ABC-type hemin transport system substrate-binding protein [Stackebrandtia albiflava]|uniref:ABC-type hemin transport system substrate-binding protein n=1 Tax=Stackebrandtia albiflava TaxID=406432 RepID=A0A562UQK4_9ACTN|nr:helical backbone metal receptor [Stackebrandtia albiflava]TWJ07888.1 ABC-type hemin transport system substrate-binding protein [Stackebrandtia albiflava]
MATVTDDLGRRFAPGPVRRVVSLVPSITETLALAAPGLLVGATDYCVHPAGLSVTRVGGSKYPRVDAVLDCEPDVVLANAEENRREDVERLEAAGVRVWTCFPKDVPGALTSASRMLRLALGVPEPDWIGEAASLWSRTPPVSRRAAIPVWRRPWMVLGGGTFAGDVLRRLGVANVFDAEPGYPRTTPDEVRERGADLVVLPDEPYEFSAGDGPEAFPGLPCALVSGRHLTWHGPSLVEAHSLLSRQLFGSA